MTDPTDPTTAIEVRSDPEESGALNVFGNVRHFATAQRMAKLLSSSDLVPDTYKGDKGIPNCLIAMEVAARTGTSIMAVTQNLYIIHGRPSWSSTYIIAAVNACGRFSPLIFAMDGEGDNRSCRAVTTDKTTGEKIEGPEVTIAMAKAEGWYSRKDRNGKESSKWPTMPELMLRYRAAAFFGRLYAPDVLMGMGVRFTICMIFPWLRLCLWFIGQRHPVGYKPMVTRFSFWIIHVPSITKSAGYQNSHANITTRFAMNPDEYS